jgi:hypothetical protein
MVAASGLMGRSVDRPTTNDALQPMHFRSPTTRTIHLIALCCSETFSGQNKRDHLFLPPPNKFHSKLSALKQNRKWNDATSMRTQNNMDYSCVRSIPSNRTHCYPLSARPSLSICAYCTRLLNNISSIVHSKVVEPSTL